MTIAEGRSSPLRVHRRERLVLTGVSQRKFSGESAIGARIWRIVRILIGED